MIENWKTAKYFEELPEIKRDEHGNIISAHGCDVQAYKFCPPNEKLDTQYGRLSVFEWLKKEAERIYNKGNKTILFRERNNMTLFWGY